MKIKEIIRILETIPPDTEAMMIKHTHGVVDIEEIKHGETSASQGRVYDIVVINDAKEKEKEELR